MMAFVINVRRFRESYDLLVIMRGVLSLAKAIRLTSGELAM